MINNKLIEILSTQSLKEIDFARQYKQGKVRNWQKNEEMYYGTKKQVDSSRANIELGRMQEFVHTLLSKIDNPLVFKYSKRKDSQLKRAQRANAIREFDRSTDWWDLKDIVGKKQAVIYGRAIYSYYADSIDGNYMAHLDPVDVYDFLIDPSAGGLDIEKARYMGRFGVKKSKAELEAGVKAGFYIKSEVRDLISNNSGTATESSKEDLNKQPRKRDQNVYTTQTEISGSDDYKFWEWYTTYEGVRYYLVINESGRVIRAELLTDLFPATKKYPQGMYPFWTWAAFLDLTEFWTPSYCDYVREIFMAQSVSINQMVDNAEQINKPQRVVNVSAIEDFASLKYRKDGVIKVKGAVKVEDVYQIVQTNSITTPIQVFNLLEAIQEKASGVTAASKGVAEEDGKVGIYEGNQAEAADRFGLLNKSYSFGYDRFGMLHQEGMRHNLNKRIAIEIIGPDGIEQENVAKRDVFRKDEDFRVNVESSNAEQVMSDKAKTVKLNFLMQQAQNPIVNPKKATEMTARLSGFSDEEIRELLDVSEFGDAILMSEADRDIEDILDGKIIKPNRMANTAYMQRFVDFMLDHEEDMNDEQKLRMFEYMDSLQPVIMENMVRKAKEKAQKEQELMMQQQLSLNSDQRDVMSQEAGI